jgi:hypothetical protein
MIPITTKAPTLSPANIKIILGRIDELHPKLNKKGAEQYLCDLLSINTLSDIEGDFLLHQEISPAVTSQELHILAERILPYNDNDLRKSIFSARNILDTTPSSLDDLIDYSTHDRKQNFITHMMSKTIVGLHNANKNIKTIDALATLMKEEDTAIIDSACAQLMLTFNQTLQENKPGITDKQRTLYSASDYYLNHRVGFQCNTIWLACFLSSETFGCQSGWTHRNGDLCNNLHFGFKDDAALPILFEQSSDYIDTILTSALADVFCEEISDGLAETVCMYIDTLVFTLSKLTKDIINDTNPNVVTYEAVLTILGNYDTLLKPEHRLMMHSLNSVINKKLGFTEVYLDEFTDLIVNTVKEPKKHLIHYFDAWNFHNFDNQFLKTGTLATLFIKAKYEPDTLEIFSEKILNMIKCPVYGIKYHELFLGFFDNFLHLAVNENSDDHFMYDSILKVALSATEEVDTSHIIRIMAELGHKDSICAHSLSTSGKELEYWSDRLVIHNFNSLRHQIN